MIMIFGSARSGTTWLGKIFNSHPDLFYLHEPDSILVDSEIPFQVNGDELENFTVPASEYISLLQDIRNIKGKSCFQVIRKPVKVVYHWKDELEKGQISQVDDFVSDSVPWRIFHDPDVSGH